MAKGIGADWGKAYLPPAEFRIFALVSKHGPVTIRELERYLAHIPEFRQGYNTIGTVLDRLRRKGYVEKIDVGESAHLFSGRLPYEEVLKSHGERFLEEFLTNSREDLGVMAKIVLGRLVAARR